MTHSENSLPEGFDSGNLKIEIDGEFVKLAAGHFTMLLTAAQAEELGLALLSKAQYMGIKNGPSTLFANTTA